MAQTSSRRGVLSLAGLLPLAIVPALPAIAADPNPDAELIALCAEFDRLEAAQRALNGAEDAEAEAAADEARTPIYEAQDALVDRMHAIPAVTLAGHAARARSLAGWAPDLMETRGDIETLLRSAILRDLTGIPATRAPEVHHEPPAPATPDPLVAMYAAFLESDRAAEVVSLRAEAIRSRLIARWGELSANQSAAAVWAHDPEYPEFHGLVGESDAHSNEASDHLDEIMATPATSVAGVIAKLRAAADIQPPTSGETDYHEDFALAALQDAVRWLSSIGGEART